MSRFSLRYPYLIIVICLIIAVVGVTSLVRMPVDLFPPIKIPVVVVATFYSGMPPEQIETDITGRFESFFTLGSGIDHIESRSLTGVSLIKIYFQPGTNADSAVTTISNLAMAQLRRLPPGTLPPVVLKFDASSLPVCLVTLQRRGHQRNEAARSGSVPGAQPDRRRCRAPPCRSPSAGKYRQIMVYVDPYKLEAHQFSLMDVVRAVNNANLILPAGDVQIGPLDYNIYTNSQLARSERSTSCPSRRSGNRPVLSPISAKPKTRADSEQHRARRWPAFRLHACHKQGGDANTIAVVDDVKKTVAPARCTQGAGQKSGLRSVGLRPDGHRESGARGRHRPGADGGHDPGFPR